MSAALTLPADRAQVALQATHEVDALLAMLKRELALDEDLGTFGLILRSTLTRLDALNYVAMGVLGEEHGRTTEDMQKVVRGEA